LYRRGKYQACRASWCAKCYKTPMTLPFPMGGYHDEEGLELPQKEDDMFAVARPGDAVMVPFQCDLCHFRNVMGRNPLLGNRADDESLWLI
jgi:hypothetical protein